MSNIDLVYYSRHMLEFKGGKTKKNTYPNLQNQHNELKEP